MIWYSLLLASCQCKFFLINAHDKFFGQYEDLTAACFVPVKHSWLSPATFEEFQNTCQLSAKLNSGMLLQQRFELRHVQ
jgi:hypothetical protein